MHYLSSAKQGENDSGYLVSGAEHLAAQGIFPSGLTKTQAESVYWTSAGAPEQDFKPTPLLICVCWGRKQATTMSASPRDDVLLRLFGAIAAIQWTEKKKQKL